MQSRRSATSPTVPGPAHVYVPSTRRQLWDFLRFARGNGPKIAKYVRPPRIERGYIVIQIRGFFGQLVAGLATVHIPVQRGSEARATSDLRLLWSALVSDQYVSRERAEGLYDLIDSSAASTSFVDRKIRRWHRKFLEWACILDTRTGSC